MGTLYCQVHGKIEFSDEANGLYGFYDIGNVKKRS
jgi:dihydroxyacetone kinase DhaKLM complex PTS-EIIA-like component DhaM